MHATWNSKHKLGCVSSGDLSVQHRHLFLLSPVERMNHHLFLTLLEVKHRRATSQKYVHPVLENKRCAFKGVFSSRIVRAATTTAAPTCIYLVLLTKKEMPAAMGQSHFRKKHFESRLMFVTWGGIYHNGHKVY